ALSGTPRLPRRSRRMSARARTLKSSAERRWSAFSSRRTSVGVPRKSKRWPTSRSVWLIALSTSWRSTRQTTSKDGIGLGSIGGRPDHVNPGRRLEAEERRSQGQVAALVREHDARGRTERVRDARLLDRRVRLAHREEERPEPRVPTRHETQHPAFWLVVLEGGREIALDPPEAGQKGDRRPRLEG